MKPEMPPYEYLYLNGSQKPPILTSDSVIRAMGFKQAADEFLQHPRWERTLTEAPHLYKYRSLLVNDPEAIEKMRGLLINEEIWCAAASTFNDAMEMDFEIKLPKSVAAQQTAARKHLKMFDRLNLTPAKRLILKQKAFRFIRSLPPHVEKGFRQDIDEDLGLYCMTSDPRNELMWGHYGDGGRGICVQFGTFNDPIFALAEKVHYSDEKAIVPLFDESDDRPKAYLNKSQVWAYEKEWRMAVIGHRGILRLAKNSVTGVIFGVKSSPAVVDAVKAMNYERVKKGFNALRLFKAQIDGRSYRICSL
jgi:hypothetical protein